MGISLIDSSTRASLELVKSLGKKLNFFINGDGIMQTDSGPVETLKRLTKRLTSTGYFHPITPYETYEEMTLDQYLVEDGMGYVQADPDVKKRGLYQVQANGTFLKQSYESITSLSSENGRELLVADIPVSLVTGPVSVYRIVIPTDVEQTVWLDLKMKAFIPATGAAGVQEAHLAVRVNQNGTVQSEMLALPASVKEAPVLGVLPIMEYTIQTQNQGTTEENRLVTIRVKSQVDNVSLVHLSVVDSSSLIYKA